MVDCTRSPILIFVEDPGAVNCIAPIVDELARRSVPVRLLSAGHATRLLHERGLRSTPWHGDSVTAAALAGPPRLLLVGTSENPDSPAFSLLACARQAGVPSAAIIDSGANSAHRFRGRTERPLAHAPDRLLVPDEPTYRAFATLGFAPERIAIVGHPDDDRLRDVAAELEAVGRGSVRKRAMRATPDRIVLVFVSEISTGLNPGQYVRSAEYTLFGRGGAMLRTEIVVEELLEAIAALEADQWPRPYMVLRRHPKETEGDLPELASEFDEVSVGGSPHDVVYAADLVVGMSSMLLVEAHRLGVPTLAVLPRACEREWLQPVRDGEIPSVFRRKDLVTALGGLLAFPGRQPVRGERGGSPSNTVDRIVDVLAGETA